MASSGVSGECRVLTSTLPAYARLIIAPDGHTWAQLYAPASLLRPMMWDVFDETRRWVGQIETPKGFWPTQPVRGDGRRDLV